MICYIRERSSSPDNLVITSLRLESAREEDSLCLKTAHDNYLSGVRGSLSHNATLNLNKYPLDVIPCGEASHVSSESRPIPKEDPHTSTVIHQLTSRDGIYGNICLDNATMTRCTRKAEYQFLLPFSKF